MTQQNAPFAYFTTRSEDKQRLFSALQAIPAEGPAERDPAPGLGDILALVEISAEGVVTVHKWDAEAVARADMDLTPEYMSGDAVEMAREFDEGATGGYTRVLQAQDTALDGTNTTFWMELDEAC